MHFQRRGGRTIQQKITVGKWEPKIKVTGGVSKIGYLTDGIGYLKGEGGIVIQTTKMGIECATHSVAGPTSLCCACGCMGVNRA